MLVFYKKRPIARQHYMLALSLLLVLPALSKKCLKTPAGTPSDPLIYTGEPLKVPVGAGTVTNTQYYSAVKFPSNSDGGWHTTHDGSVSLGGNGTFIEPNRFSTLLVSYKIKLSDENKSMTRFRYGLAAHWWLGVGDNFYVFQMIQYPPSVQYPNGQIVNGGAIDVATGNNSKPVSLNQTYNGWPIVIVDGMTVNFTFRIGTTNTTDPERKYLALDGFYFLKGY